MVCGVWHVVCGLYCVVYSVWYVVYEVWCMVGRCAGNDYFPIAQFESVIGRHLNLLLVT